MLERRTTLLTRLGAAALVATSLATVAAVAPATASRRPSVAALQAQRLALIGRIAEATDRVAGAELRVTLAKRRQAVAQAGYETARRRFAHWAVDAFVEGGDDPQEAQLRQKSWVEVVAADDRARLEQVRSLKAAADRITGDAQQAVADAQRSRHALEDLRAALEHTIADRATEGALPAPDGPDEVRPGATRVTHSQADLMARYPFGPVTSFPDGLVPTGTVIDGMASWYGPGFDGRSTASGAIFDQEGFTVASRTLPLGTILLITRGDLSALVLVNDRGPYVTGRVLDLSKGVARALDTISAGVARVHAEVLVPVGE